MLKQKGMPNSPWGEIVTTTAYVLDRFSTRRLKNKVSEEVWSDKKPYVNHLKVFVSICYKHVPDAKRKKLDDKSESMILVGYHKTGACRFFNLINGRIIVSRDIGTKTTQLTSHY